MHDPLRTAVGRWMMQALTETTELDQRFLLGKSDVRSCADQAPWHPLVPVSLGRLEPRIDDQTDPIALETMPIRLRFLARLTLKRLRDADENLYGRDTLAAYAGWSAKIMHEELHLDPEALEAIALALERTPPEKQKELLELKARIAPVK